MMREHWSVGYFTTFSLVLLALAMTGVSFFYCLILAFAAAGMVGLVLEDYVMTGNGVSFPCSSEAADQWHKVKLKGKEPSDASA